VPFAADVLLYFLDALDRDVELVVAGIFEMEKIPFDRSGLEMEEAAVDGDAVIGMDDIIADFELGQGVEKGASLGRSEAATVGALAEDLFFGDDGDLFIGKTEPGGKVAEHQEELAGLEILEADFREDLRRPAIGGEKIAESLGLAALVTDEKDTPFLTPRPGSRGTTVAFVHPKTAFGTLIELVQE
jgi:hypothetical protein